MGGRFNKRKLNPKPNNLTTDFEELKLHYKDLRTESIDGEIVLDAVNDLNVLVEKVISKINIK